MTEDVRDNAEVTAEMTETAKQTGEQTKPWVIAKAHHKFTTAKKRTNKTPKRGAGGAKAKKKSASKTDQDGEHTEIDSSGTGLEPQRSSEAAQSDNASAFSANLTCSDVSKVQQLRDSERRTSKTKDLLQQTADALCDDEISPTVNGMRHFGISKGVISRAIVRFTSAPEPHPLTLCFHFPGTFLTHKYVLEMLRSKLESVSNARVTVIQFSDRNTIHGTQGLDNRWLVTFNSAEAKEHLLRHGLSLFNKKIKLRSYDDVLNDEYMEYLEYEQLQKSLYARREQLEASDTGDASLDDGASNDQAQQDIEIEDHSDPPTTAFDSL